MDAGKGNSVSGDDGKEQFNLLAECRDGLLLFNRHDLYVGRSLQTYGEFSQGEATIFAQLLAPGDVVLEAGANIGAHTVGLARQVGPSGTILAYEPQRLVFQCLCANLALNSLRNVKARQAALGTASGVLKVPLLDPASSNNFGGLSIDGHDEGEEVAVETIDSLNLPRLRLIKADVEGMESEVLLGAAQTIRRLRPLLYVENDRQNKSPSLIRLIRDFGYRLWWHTPTLFNPGNWRGVQDNVFPGIVSINMLCVPEEHAWRIEGAREVAGPQDWPLAAPAR